MSTTHAPQSQLSELTRLLRDTDAAALFVPPRIMRRVIREDQELAGLIFNVPHRKSYVIRWERLLQFVDREELGLGPDDELPAVVILITKPDEDRLAEIEAPVVMTKYWRLLFHARIHAALEQRIAAGLLPPATIRQRIDRIGQAAFDEIHSVLRQEHYLFASATPTDVYVEFAAVFLELRWFAPHWLPTYFPSLHDPARIEGILSDDVDADDVLRSTRLPGTRNLDADLAHPHEEEAAERMFRDAVAEVARPQPRRSRKLMARAEKAKASGNAVGAATLRLRAARRATAADADQLSRSVLADVRDLVERLQAALGFDDSEATAWRSALIGLLRNSTWGFWNPDKRLLHDLQKVCVTHEREIYTVDLLAWLRSLGRRSLKHPLPRQRDVLISKHLRRATVRLTATRLSGAERRRLAGLLHRAASAAEQQLRDRLRPLIDRALSGKGLQPQNVPERVARRKLIEELLDGVVQRGYLTMGHFRDAVSRSDLKLPDLSGPTELLRGDPLLRADKKLAVLLDGVYHRGEFYLRWLQRLSSLAFGTRTGRLATKFIAIPFGGAYLVLEGVHHLLDWFVEHPPHVSGWPFVLVGGLFLMGMIHAEPFRRAVMETCRVLFRLVRGILYDLPVWIANRAVIRRIVRSRPVVMARKLALVPLVVTLAAWLALPQLGISPRPSPWLAVALFVVLAALLNSRMGRNLEEVSAEWAERIWYRIGARFFIALYELIMETFKRGLEWFERILYAVDEWLQFKSGETSFTLAMKAVMGMVWGVVIFVARFCVNLLIEPQINPIKHFPVVTVSHKIILPLGFPNGPLSRLLLPLVGTKDAANAIAGTTVFLIPGIFGFLVWELKSNWRLYEANRHRTLTPVTVGSHGETLLRLLKPGFHSGTVPKLFAKLRRAERKAMLPRYRNARRKYAGRLHHIEDEVRHFIDREFIALLDESHGWGGLPVSVTAIEVASNSLSVDLHTPSHREPMRLSFQEQSGWLVASVTSMGWARDLSPPRRAVLLTALAGLYKRGAVDLVREQMETSLKCHACPYDVRENWLVVWPTDDYDREIRYDLLKHALIKPRPTALAAVYGLPTIEANRLIFRESEMTWKQWVRLWQVDQNGEPIPPLDPVGTRLLPPEERRPPVPHPA